MRSSLTMVTSRRCPQTNCSKDVSVICSPNFVMAKKAVSADFSACLNVEEEKQQVRIPGRSRPYKWKGRQQKIGPMQEMGIWRQHSKMRQEWYKREDRGGADLRWRRKGNKRQKARAGQDYWTRQGPIKMKHTQKGKGEHTNEEKGWRKGGVIWQQ